MIGENTLGENIADNAGIAIALKAYHISLNGKPAPVIDGLTGDQRFYLSFGQIWRTKQRDSSLRTQTLSNEHSPAEFRVIGPTRNQDEWYAAFDVQAGRQILSAAGSAGASLVIRGPPVARRSACALRGHKPVPPPSARPAGGGR